MNIYLFVGAIAASMAVLYSWAFKVLPGESWQFIAAVPITKEGINGWKGLNLTFYGFFQALSNSLAVAVLFVLMGSIGISALVIALLVVVVVGLCWWAASLIASLVENRRNTFTIGGASFAGALITPLVILLINSFSPLLSGAHIPLTAGFAAVVIAYAYGEGIGRLACISFGCCYGRRLDEISGVSSRLFSRFSVVFRGSTRKAVYDGNLEGIALVPIQACTSIIFSVIALVSTVLFLEGKFLAALCVAGTLTQTWRFISENFRADQRGPATRLTSYQVMSLTLAVMIPLFGLVLFEASGPPVLGNGLRAIWTPAAIIFCQLVGGAVFLITGRSKVTFSRVYLHVNQERIQIS